jgi:hypothetical protein
MARPFFWRMIVVSAFIASAVTLWRMSGPEPLRVIFNVGEPSKENPGCVRLSVSNGFDFPIYYQLTADSDGTNTLAHLNTGVVRAGQQFTMAYEVPETNWRPYIIYVRDDHWSLNARWRLPEFIPILPAWLNPEAASWEAEGPAMFGTALVMTVNRTP